MRRLSVPEEYRGYTISFHADFTVSFSCGGLSWAAASFRDARRRIDILTAAPDRRRRSSSPALPGQSDLIQS
jgi:hypothetical protein